MQRITLTFTSNYGFSAGFQQGSPLNAPTLIVGAARLKELALKQPDKVEGLKGPASVWAEIGDSGEGPVRVGWEGLGCPRDQLLMVAAYMDFIGHLIWQQTQANSQQQAQAKQRGPTLVLPGQMFPMPGQNNPMRQ